jgi:hypothetical protein
MDPIKTWQTLSEGQGAVLASVITLVAALAGIVLGRALFSGTIRSLETAISAAETKTRDHLGVVERALAEYEDKLNAQLSALALQLGQVSGSVADAPTSPPEPVGPAEQNAKDLVREYWAKIRDRLETIATNPTIDGRTRGKYGRIDRRNYGDLVSSLDADGMLGDKGAKFRAAVELWHRFRPGRIVPSPDEVQKMRILSEELTGEPQ